tara:strand:- start:188 stop:949 length:762 start_codon:yes stop_codon:yes gene_type:complete
VTSKSVDIIIPNYNKKRYLEEAILSVLDQSFKNWTLYIIDDNSNDGSQDVINKFINHEKIIFKKLSKNKGPSFCRNLGMRISSSEYIAFLDSDDLWKKNKLHEQVDFMNKNDYQFTFTDYTSFIEKDNKNSYLKATNLIQEFDLKKFTHNSSINTSTMIVSRSILKNIKFKKLKKLEDYLFKCEILKKGHKAYKLNSNSAFYRIMKNSRSSARFENIRYLWKINKDYLKLNFFQNFHSILMISYNSLKKYGFK